MRFADKVAVVTGASRGIGRAIAIGLAKEGADIVAVAQSTSATAEVVSDIKLTGRKVLSIAADVSRSSDSRDIVRAALETFGRIDILVNNAGIHLRASFVDESEELWNKLFRINVLGCTFITQAVVPHMIERHYGRIVNISSKAAVVGEPGHVAYSSLKGAVLAHDTRARSRSRTIWHNRKCSRTRPRDDGHVSYGRAGQIAATATCGRRSY